jgi:hypothetical protein
MGRYKDYRELMTTTMRSTTERLKGGQIIRLRVRHKHRNPVDAVVKWFNAEKGFGFVGLGQWRRSIHTHP